MEPSNISEKFNLMLINFTQIDNVEEKLGNGDYTGLLLGMPVIIRYIGLNNEKIQKTVSDLSKYAHPNLAINYGIVIKKENSEEKVYIVRDLVQGKNFYSSTNLNTHNKIVSIYKIVCVFEFLHSFNVYYTFLHPNNIIITKDISLKLLDLITDKERKLEEIRKNPLNDEMRFFCPEVFDTKNVLEHINTEYVDIYSIGCHIFYAIFQEIPWKQCHTKEDILNCYLNKELFLEEDHYENKDDPFVMKMLGIVVKCLNKEFSNVTELREELEESDQIKLFLEEDFVDIDYEKECDQLTESINNLVLDIGKLVDNSQNNRQYFNTMSSKMNSRLDFTKANVKVYKDV